MWLFFPGALGLFRTAFRRTSIAGVFTDSLPERSEFHCVKKKRQNIAIKVSLFLKHNITPLFRSRIGPRETRPSKHVDAQTATF